MMRPEDVAPVKTVAETPYMKGGESSTSFMEVRLLGVCQCLWCKGGMDERPYG